MSILPLRIRPRLGLFVRDSSAVTEMMHRVLQWGGPVGDGATGANYVTLEGVSKMDTRPNGYYVANEFICNKLAMILGLPVPTGVLVPTASGFPAFVSLRFGPANSRPPPVIPQHLVEDHPKLSGQVVAFDCWIINADRHARNLAYSRGNIAPAVFDHSHALFGPGAGDGVSHIEDKAGKPVISGCIPPVLDDSSGIYGMADRILSLHSDTIESVFLEAANFGLITDEEATRGAMAMTTRSYEVATLCEAEQAKFPKITQWGLSYE